MCGTCTILLDGDPVRSCVLPMSSVGESQVTTIEGLSENGGHPLQKTWLEQGVRQCGFCQPGQILNALAFLKENLQPRDKDIDSAMSGNICRCGTYTRIKDAIKDAAHVAMIGSQKRAQETLDFLKIHDHVEVPLYIPAGLDLGCKKPAEIALSVVAEVIQREVEDGE